MPLGKFVKKLTAEERDDRTRLLQPLKEEFEKRRDSLRLKLGPRKTNKAVYESICKYGNFEDSTISRMLNYETTGSSISVKTLQRNFTRATALMELLESHLNLVDKQPSASPSEVTGRGNSPESGAVAPASNQESDPLSGSCEFRMFRLFYWDWNETYQVDGLTKHGKVVEGSVELPLHWEGSGARLMLADGKVEMEGTLWVRPSPGKGDYNVSIRFCHATHPDLFMTLHIASGKKSDILVGAFASATTSQYSPFHGTCYLHIKPNATGTAPHPIDADDLKICHTLFQQTTVLNDKLTIPRYVRNSYDTYDKEFRGRQFIGYFINTWDATLESFLARVENDGRVMIVYHKHDANLGKFQRYHEDIIWFDFDYDHNWRQSRYRMNFRKHNDSDWYLGMGSGADNGGSKLFMNRVAMVETKVPKQQSDIIKPIALNAANQSKIDELLADKPILKTYLSGAPTQSIRDNERFSETPTLLQLAGLLTSSSQPADQGDYQRIKGDYALYSLSRNVAENDKGEENETFSIVKLPLYIDNNGSTRLKGDKKTYFGNAFYKEDKLVLLMTKRQLDGSDTFETANLTFYLKIERDKHGTSITKYSIGTSNRFVNALPEARHEVLVRREGGQYETDKYESFAYFSRAWISFKEKNPHMTLYFSGRINRLIVPHKLTGRPEKRQDDFRQLFAHAASSFLKDDQSEQFVHYFYQAVSHSFGQDKADKELYDQLVVHFNKVYERQALNWKKSLRNKAQRLNSYLNPKNKTKTTD